MKDVFEVLREKESQLERLGKEIKVLRVAAKILTGENQGEPIDLAGAEEGHPVESTLVPEKGRWP